MMLAVTAWGLGGCGFRPLYSSNDAEPGVRARLAEISVDLIPERSGQLLRQALQARLERGGAGTARRFDLAVQLVLAFEPIAVQADNSTSRVRIIGTANWVLRAQDAQRSTVASGSAREVDGYNIINQQFFAAELTNAAVQRRMTETLAEQIATQVALHFSRREVG
jgi:LPS-assembly lipoprotein